MRGWPAPFLWIACAALPPAAAQTSRLQRRLHLDLAQQELARFEKLVTVKVLPNGLTVLLIERPEAPVFSYYTLVDAGRRERSDRAVRPGAHVRAPRLQGHR